MKHLCIFPFRSTFSVTTVSVPLGAVPLLNEPTLKYGLRYSWQLQNYSLRMQEYSGNGMLDMNLVS